MKNSLIGLLILISTILTFNIAQAGHYAGSELTYVNIGGSSYKVTLTLYRDCSSVAAPNNTLIYFTCDTTNSMDFNSTLSIVGGLEITKTCPQVGTSCTSGYSSAFGVEKYTYEGVVTIPPCSNWTMYWTGGSRRVYTTIMNGNNWYIPAKLNNLGINNSSPIFYNNMIPIVFLNEFTVFDYGGVDPDGDSLSYSFYGPYGTGPNPISSLLYNIPYGPENFVPSSTPITLDSLTGTITFTPSYVMSSIIGVRIDEWRVINGVTTKIGSTFRDFSFNVTDQGINILPVLSGVDTTLSHSYLLSDSVYTINKCYDGNPIEFRINGYDSDVYNATIAGSPELFEIDWSEGISNATFTAFNNGTDSAYADFYWQPNNNDFFQSNLFTATISDLACSYVGTNTYVYEINLFDNFISIGNDTTICFGEVLSIKSVSDNTYFNYAWSIDGNVFSSTSVDSVVIQPSLLSPGTHILKLETQGGNNASGCDNTQEITITVLDIHPSGSIADTAFCQNQSITYDAGAGTSYLWTDFSGALVGTSQYFTPMVSGVYGLIVQNQSCESRDTFEVQIIASPPAFSLGNDTTISNNASLTLSMPLGYSDYLWSDGSTNNTLVIDNSFNWINAITGTITESSICKSSDTIMVYIGNVGIIGSQKNNVKVYPNPIDDVLNIKLRELNSNTKLKLYDVNGKLVRSAEFSTQEFMLKGLGNLSSGNYYLKIYTENEEIEYSIIKK